MIDDVLEIAERLDVADMPHEVEVIRKTLDIVREKNPLYKVADSLDFIEYLLWDFVRFVKYASAGGIGLTLIYFGLKINGMI